MKQMMTQFNDTKSLSDTGGYWNSQDYWKSIEMGLVKNEVILQMLKLVK